MESLLICLLPLPISKVEVIVHGIPKKPYRLKLDKKTSILGLPEAKNRVLLANFQDYTLMTNAVAMKIGQLLGLPFTIWDFDWGFGMDEDSRKYFNYVDLPLLKQNDQRLGGVFFSKFLEDPEVRALYKQ